MIEQIVRALNRLPTWMAICRNFIYQEPALAFNMLHVHDRQLSNNGLQSLTDILKEGFLYAVPKKRRSIEVRLRKKFGDDRWGISGAKMLKPRYDLIICEGCGHYKEENTLCYHCYKEIQKETEKIQRTVDEQFFMKPIEKDIDVKYTAESNFNLDPNKILVEIEGERPAWFSKNLLSKTNSFIEETAADTTQKKVN